MLLNEDAVTVCERKNILILILFYNPLDIEVSPTAKLFTVLLTHVMFVKKCFLLLQ